MMPRNVARQVLTSTDAIIMSLPDAEKRENAQASISIDRRSLLLGGTILAAAAAANGAVAVGSAKAQEQPAASNGKPPNILVIFGDDIGIPQISAYTMHQEPVELSLRQGIGTLLLDGVLRCHGRINWISHIEPSSIGTASLRGPESSDKPQTLHRVSMPFTSSREHSIN